MFKISKDGSLQNLKILKTSGSESFDKKALDAISKSAPFSPLPEKFNGNSIDVKFYFDYNLYKKYYYQTYTNSSPYEIRETQTSNLINNNHNDEIKNTILKCLPPQNGYVNREIIVDITIDKNGNLISVLIQRPSGNKNFDNKIIESIKKCHFSTIPEPTKLDNFTNTYLIKYESQNEAVSSDSLLSSILYFAGSIIMRCTIH